MQPVPPGDLNGLPVLCHPERPLELPEEWFAGIIKDVAAGPVLGHDIHVGVPGELVSNEPHHRFGAGEIVGEHQVPDDQPADSDAVPDDQVPCLPVHLPERRLVHAGVPRCIRETERHVDRKSVV